MFNFLKRNHFLGIDFGTSAIKVVELVYKKEDIYLSNYGQITYPVFKGLDMNLDNLMEGDEVSRKTKLLKELLEKMKISTGVAHISMGGFRGLSMIINIKNAERSALKELVKVEASKCIPMPLDETYLSWDVVTHQEVVATNNEDVQKSNAISDKIRLERSVKENMEVLLVAAPKEDVKKYEQIINNVGLKVESLELDIFAITRSLIKEEQGVFLIIDMGAKVTNLILVDNSIIRVNRSINKGGDEITNKIKVNLNISWERAEEFKKKNDYLSAEGKSIIVPVLEMIAREANRIIASYNKKYQKKLNDIIITGGGSHVVKIEKTFSDIVGLPVIIANPWSKIKIENEKIKKESIDLSTGFTVATGLAMKGAEEYKRN